MEINKTSSFEKNTKHIINDLSIYKKFINKRSKISLVKKKSQIKKIETNLFLTQKNSPKKLEKPIKNKSKIKIKYIKDLLLNPTEKKVIFDGYAVFRKKYSYHELIKKVSQKENRECLEKNKLFKNPFPLIKFLSNRKLYNNSNSLITDLLNNDISKITREQIITINKNKTNNKNNISLNNSNNSFNYFNKTQSYINNKKKNKIFRTLKLKTSIRLYDYFNSNYRLTNDINSHFNTNDNSLIIHNYNKSHLPLVNKYIKNRVINHDINNNHSHLFIKKNNLNKSEKRPHLSKELFNNYNNNNKLKDCYFRNNTSICKDENDSYKIRSISNKIFHKKNIYTKE